MLLGRKIKENLKKSKKKQNSFLAMADGHYSSFDDSEQFEEDSSWISDTDQDVKWCGWKRASPVSVEAASNLNDGKQVKILLSLCLFHIY